MSVVDKKIRKRKRDKDRQRRKLRWKKIRDLVSIPLEDVAPTIFVTAGVCYFCCEKIPIKPVTVPNITDYMCDRCNSFGK